MTHIKVAFWSIAVLTGSATFGGCGQMESEALDTTVSPLATPQTKQRVEYEPCYGTAESSPDGTPVNHFVYWDHDNFILLGSLSWTLDPSSTGANGPIMFEYSENVKCRGHLIRKCTATDTEYIVGQTTPITADITWAVKENKRMDVLEFKVPSDTSMKTSCSSFPAKGDICRSVVQRLQKFVVDNGIVLNSIVLTEDACL